MPKRRWIMWQGLIAPSLQRLVVTTVDAGFEVSGLILQAYEGASYVVRYRIELDPSWATRSVELALDNGERQAVTAVRELDGEWKVDGKRRSDLDRCTDVDVEWSPSTNTLPIRRLDLPRGSRQSVTAAWIRLPTLVVEPLEQAYERVDEHRYRYISGEFKADLEVDEEGWVTRYGVSWKAVATG